MSTNQGTLPSILDRNQIDLITKALNRRLVSFIDDFDNTHDFIPLDMKESAYFKRILSFKECKY